MVACSHVNLYNQRLKKQDVLLRWQFVCCQISMHTYQYTVNTFYSQLWSKGANWLSVIRFTWLLVSKLHILISPLLFWFIKLSQSPHCSPLAGCNWVPAFWQCDNEIHWISDKWVGRNLFTPIQRRLTQLTLFKRTDVSSHITSLVELNILFRWIMGFPHFPCWY